MKEEHAKPDHKKSVRRFDRLLPKRADELTIVLKGHLLIEEQLRGIVRATQSNPEYFDQTRLSYSNVLLLARAVAGHLNKTACWSAAEKLNSVRNHLAHQAEPRPYTALFDEFYRVCEAEPQWEGLRSLPRGKEKLRAYISMTWVILETLHEVAHVFVECNAHPILVRPRADKIPTKKGLPRKRGSNKAL